MITAAKRELAGVGVEDKPGLVLADAGYWSNALPNLAACGTSRPLLRS
jgi:hypothetical protein